MTDKKKVQKKITTHNMYNLEGTYAEVMEFFKQYEDREGIIFEVVEDYDNVSVLGVWQEREETDAEYKKRIDLEAAQKKDREARDLKELARLKALYGE